MSINLVTLFGNLTRNPDVKYTSQQMCVARFSIALNRGKDKNGQDKGADYPNIVCFGKTAEIAEKYLQKGSKICITGRLHTDSYEKDGAKVYTTDVIADKIEFMFRNESKFSESHSEEQIEGFQRLTDEDIPF